MSDHEEHYEETSLPLLADSAKPSRRLNLSVQYAGAREGLPVRADFVRWARAALVDGGTITIRLVDADEGQALNREYRGKDYATNVLTFTYDELPDVPGLPLMGDLVFCHPVVVREAAEQQLPLAAHYAHLTVHGMLHLQGYDHEHDDEAEIMEALETRILQGLGFADPYAAEKLD